jgi:hypothetical protein
MDGAPGSCIAIEDLNDAAQTLVRFETLYSLIPVPYSLGLPFYRNRLCCV